jgi:OOP family OmpA-OmpF porin
LSSTVLEEFMKSMHSALIGGALLLATASTGFAQDGAFSLPSGLYIRGDVGGASGADTTFKDKKPASINSLLGTTTQPSSTGSSVIFGGGVGYRFTPMFRSDVTVDYIPSLKVTGHNSLVPTLTNSADLSSLVGMVNGYLDINGFAPNMFGRFQPYLQGGVGIARNDLDKTSFGGPFAGVTLSGSTRTNFAWGVGAGLGYAITPNLTLDVGYKYLDLGEMRTGSTVSIAGVSTGVTPAKADLQAHTVMVGLRFGFGAPAAPPPAPTPVVAAPPAPPPAAVAPSKQMFIVFFEFDKSALTADGKNVVDAAATAFKSGKSGIAIAGYTDLSGTQPYNMALSKRRADTVRAALVRDGVPAPAIDESWHGKENPRVPTADGVREPQNRRVEISM